MYSSFEGSSWIWIYNAMLLNNHKKRDNSKGRSHCLKGSYYAPVHFILSPSHTVTDSGLNSLKHIGAGRKLILRSLYLWPLRDPYYFLGRSLDVFVSRLRKHLNESGCVSIENVYGVGFIFRVSE